MSRRGAATLEPPASPDPASAETPQDAGPPNQIADRRRFTLAAGLALAVAAIPYLWVLMWNGRRLDPLRTGWPDGVFSNFYDLQARALFDGHWWVPKGELSIEAFVIDGHDYMYFAPFPALLRMPVMLFTDRLDGQLTSLSLLLAWAITGVFVSLLFWRVRLLVVGSAALGRAEAASYAIVIATIMSGSVLLVLASLPAVYHEAFAWSAAASTGAMFVLVGILQRPSMAQIYAVGGLTLAATLSRNTAGWGCAIALTLAAGWFAFGGAGPERRRWWIPVLAAAAIPFAIGCAINWIKFGYPLGIPMSAQVFTQVNEHRREVLAENDGRLWNLRFAPSTLWAYLRPDGLRIAPVYPFITLPAEPARGLGGVTLDQTYRTASLPATMPLLFLLGIWGFVTAFRPRAVGLARLVRIPLLGAAAGTAGVVLWGYIATRYLGDLLPLLILGVSVGVVDVWRRLADKNRRQRSWVLALIALFGFFGLVVNLAISSTPPERFAWPAERVRDYVELQKSISDRTGHPLNRRIVQGDDLPEFSPADRLFVLRDCEGLFLSTGEIEHTWIPVELKQTRVELAIDGPLPRQRQHPVVSFGERPATTLLIEGDGGDRIRFRATGADPGDWLTVEPGRTYPLEVGPDPAARPLYPLYNEYQVVWDGRREFAWLSETAGEAMVRSGSAASGALSIHEVPGPEPTLCRSLLAGS